MTEAEKIREELDQALFAWSQLDTRAPETKVLQHMLNALDHMALVQRRSLESRFQSPGKPFLFGVPVVIDPAAQTPYLSASDLSERIRAAHGNNPQFRTEYLNEEEP